MTFCLAMRGYPVHTALTLVLLGTALAGARLLAPRVNAPDASLFAGVVDFSPERVPSGIASDSERHWATPMVSARPPEPEPAIAEPEPEPEPLLMADPPPIDLDDLDTPAYLRQGRLLN